MSLDKDASSDPNLKAVHAGASMRKAQHLQPKASDVADAEVGFSIFAFFRLAAHIRVLAKSGEKPTLPAKRSYESLRRIGKFKQRKFETRYPLRQERPVDYDPCSEEHGPGAFLNSGISSAMPGRVPANVIPSGLSPNKLP